MSGRSYLARAARAATICLLSVIAACGDDPQVPTTAAAIAGSTFSGTVGTVLQAPPSVRVTDQKGRAVKGLLVRFRVVTGGGRVSSDTVRTDATGQASSGGWVLGTTAGTQTLEAAAGALTTTFTATALPGPAARLSRLSANDQTAPVATPVGAAPSARAEDQYGNAVPGVGVLFTVVQGTGSVDGSQQTTNAQGVATVQSWTLGTQSGPQILRASATGATPVDFAAVAQPGAAVNLVKIAGDNQIGAFSTVIPVAPGVRVVDQFGNGVGNIPVSFMTGANSGTITSPLVSSDPANGTAFVGSWILGPTATTQTLTASSASVPGRAVTFTASASASAFDIDVRFVGPAPRPAVQQAFAVAAARWKSAIVADLHRTIVRSAAGGCGASWLPAINETINDVVIYARIDSIDHRGDSTGNILGQASPCAVNVSTRLTAYGLMQFDSLDIGDLVADGSITNVIVHEMGHVLGIGTLWNFQRSLLTGAGTNDPYFSGPTARAQFAALNTVTYSGMAVPVENQFGAGTRDSHWRESILRNELMTGFLNRGSNPLSRISLGSLQDLGYTVNLSAADSYSLTAQLRYAFPFQDDGSLRRMHNDVRRGEIDIIGTDGRVVGRLKY